MQTDKTKALLKRIPRVLGVLILVTLAAAIIVGLIPVSIEEFASAPNPASDYETAVQRFNEIKQQEAGILMSESAGSQLMAHGEKTDRVYVLIHGLTSSPQQWVEFGQLLHERGHNVLIVRIPYHGLESYNVSELKQLLPADLAAYADETVDIAAGLGEEIYVLGLSVGGTISSWIAQNRPDVSCVMLVAAMFGIDHLPSWLDTFLMNLFSRAPNLSAASPLEPYNDHGYRGYSTRGLAETMIFGESVFLQARVAPPAVSTIIAVTNGADTTIDNRHTEELAGVWEQAGANVLRYQFPTSLGLPHDMIDPVHNSDADSVYPELLKLLGE
jgi:esterase/lipase